ncbi:hypothetical protein PMI42_02088 [Bradyrhizobium sp. YR681]|uniref:hypothetical protein n=1 Tax=Bradyrhizobium sp. YR681 TaxID=1144344 RepID=UPI000270FD59|nr:hypothetical protein [Bradyrhizobium sp. YR681]EJN14348.1 hypothetical protein PMI42_02088 [Bradyrhizobium sp. YR681]
MVKWVALAVAAGLAAGLPCAATAQQVAKPDASAGRAVFDVRKHARYHEVAQPTARHDPPYYARPVFYRPYPYGVPAPFVIGYGPFW